MSAPPRSVQIPSRLFCTSLLYILRGPLSFFAKVISLAFEGHPRLELFFVVFGGPFFVNTLQFILIDRILAADHPKVAAAAVAGASDIVDVSVSREQPEQPLPSSSSSSAASSLASSLQLASRPSSSSPSRPSPASETTSMIVSV